MRKSKNILFIAVVALASAIILSEFGLIRALRLASLSYIILHCCFIIFFQIALSVLIMVRYPISRGKKILALSVFFFLITALWLLLIGYRQFVAGIVCSGVALSCITLFWDGPKKIRWRGLACAGLSFLMIVTVCLSCYLPGKIQMKKRLEDAPLADHSAGFAHANAPKTVYRFPLTEYKTEDGVLLKSLQGCLGLTSDVQILLENRYEDQRNRELYSIPVYLETIEKYYPEVTLTEVNDFEELLEKVGPLIENYILCDEEDPESCTVAFNLCHRFRSVVLGKTHLRYAEKYGWKRVFDTTGKDEKWLMNSEYFASLNKSFVFMSKPLSMFGSYADYVIISGSWMFNLKSTIKELEKILCHLDRNFILVGGLNGMDERAVVSAVSRYSGTFIFSGAMCNVSALSGFRLEDAAKTGVNTESGVKRKTTNPNTETGKGKHTVCVVLSDGDNMRFVSGEALAYPNFLGSDQRTKENNLTYGMSGMATLLMPLVLLAHYDRMSPAEDYVMQLGSVGYVLPSYWQDDEAFGKVTDLLAQSMEVADIHVVELMDDISFLDATDAVTDYNSMQRYFDKYTSYDNINGCLFINFMDLYSGFKGKVCWSNNKPVVSARYSVWNDIDNSLASEQNSIEYIADAINHASRDERSEDGYSFIIMHAWSGLDENGNLVPNRDAVAAMTKLVSLFDEDVDVVSAEEFIDRMNKNVKR